MTPLHKYSSEYLLLYRGYFLDKLFTYYTYYIHIYYKYSRYKLYINLWDKKTHFT